MIPDTPSPCRSMNMYIPTHVTKDVAIFWLHDALSKGCHYQPHYSLTIFKRMNMSQFAFKSVRGPQN